MACKAWHLALLAACLLHSSALAQRYSSGGAASTRSGGSFRATAPPPPRAGASGEYDSNSGSGGFVSTLGSTPSRSSSGGTNTNSGGSAFGALSNAASSTSYGLSSRGASSQESSFPGEGLSSSSGSGGSTTSGSGGTTSSGSTLSTSSAKMASTTTASTTTASTTTATTAALPADTNSPTAQTSAGFAPNHIGTVTSSSTGCGVGGLTNCGGGNSDPVMYGFAGRAFNFIGDSGKIYNIISTLNIQVSMRLKLAQMWDHNGTNMEAIGFMYRSYKVLVSLDAREDVVVTAQGRTLKVKNTAKHYAWRFDDGAYIQTTWERYKPGLGNTVIIETDVLKMTIWQTPAGIVDEGGMLLGAWLNFGLSLEAPPANGLMHGIVGGTYDRFIMGESAVSDPKSQLYLPADGAFHGRYKDEEYEMADHWDTDFKANLFGVQNPVFQTQQQGRSNLEIDAPRAAFPAFARSCFLCEATPSGQGYTF